MSNLNPYILKCYRALWCTKHSYAYSLHFSRRNDFSLPSLSKESLCPCVLNELQKGTFNVVYYMICFRPFIVFSSVKPFQSVLHHICQQFNKTYLDRLMINTRDWHEFGIAWLDIEQNYEQCTNYTTGWSSQRLGDISWRRHRKRKPKTGTYFFDEPCWINWLSCSQRIRWKRHSILFVWSNAAIQ